LYGEAHVIASVPSRQFVRIAPKVLAKAENNFVDTPGIVLGMVEMTTLLTAASGLLRKLEMDKNAEASKF
jgi:hypothetical protein